METMRYDGFVEKTCNYAVFGEDLLGTLDWSKAAMKLQLSRWVKNKRLIRVKRGLYALPERYQKTPFSKRWLANAMYSPSYVSLEYALSWYDLIPERVTSITSVTTVKTATFTNPLGEFVYKNFKKALFFGFEEVRDEYQQSVLMATKEKTLLDFIYFCKGWEPTSEFLEHNLRLQQLDQLEKKKLKMYSKKFESKKISEATELLLTLI